MLNRKKVTSVVVKKSINAEQVLDVVVLGGGAAGLMAAMTAAERGRSVQVLERSNKLGKKILMSGGGRCNFTNLYVEADHFLSQNPHFVKSALQQFPAESFIERVETHAIEYEERKHGQLFCKGSAKDILQMLVAECQRTGVQWQTDCKVTALTKADAEVEVNGRASPLDPSKPVRFIVTVNKNGETKRYACRSLIVATGALSIPTLGGSDQGYWLAEQFGLSLVARHPGLVPFVVTDDLKRLCVDLAGVSIPVTARCNGMQFSEELLFTHRGLSGPVMLQISSYWRPGDDLELDLLPHINLDDLLVEQKLSAGSKTISSALQGVWPNSLVLGYLKRFYPTLLTKRLADTKDRELKALCHGVHHFGFKPAATEGYRTAEVTLGGVATKDLSSKTLEAKSVPGLYFVGEVVDVSGHLGGFNFQWAWASGFCAGQVA